MAFLAALICWTASLCVSEPLGPLADSPDQPHSIRPRLGPRQLLGAVGVLTAAVAMLSLQAALPLAVRRAAPAGGILERPRLACPTTVRAKGVT